MMSLKLAEVFRELEAKYDDLQVLAEERRLALVKCDPYNDDSRCHFCNWACDYFFDQHADNCDYVRLTKD